MRSKIWVVFLVLTVSLALGSVAWGASKEANFPKRPLEMVIPFWGGGGQRHYVEADGKILEKYVPQPVRCVNKAGGGTVEKA